MLRTRATSTMLDIQTYTFPDSRSISNIHPHFAFRSRATIGIYESHDGQLYAGYLQHWALSCTVARSFVRSYNLRLQKPHERIRSQFNPRSNHIPAEYATACYSPGEISQQQSLSCSHVLVTIRVLVPSICRGQQHI